MILKSIRFLTAVDYELIRFVSFCKLVIIRDTDLRQTFRLDKLIMKFIFSIIWFSPAIGW